MSLSLCGFCGQWIIQKVEKKKEEKMLLRTVDFRVISNTLSHLLCCSNKSLISGWEDLYKVLLESEVQNGFLENKNKKMKKFLIYMLSIVLIFVFIIKFQLLYILAVTR